MGLLIQAGSSRQRSGLVVQDYTSMSMDLGAVVQPEESSIHAAIPRPVARHITNCNWANFTGCTV